MPNRKKNVVRVNRVKRSGKSKNAKGESRTVKEGGIEVKKEKVEIVKEDRKVGLLVVATLCTK